VDFNKQSSQRLTDLLPNVRNLSQADAKAPEGCYFVLRSHREYFSRFSKGMPATVCSVARARLFPDAILAACHGKFWLSRLNGGAEIFVEVYRPPAQIEFLGARKAGPSI
jgi:hypothetical protein